MRAALVLPVALASCGILPDGSDGPVTAPVTGVTQDGLRMTGTNTVDPATGTGSFTVTTADGALSCSGTYDAVLQFEELTLPVTCTDGRSGEVAVSREPGLQSGAAVATLTDGTVAQFVFGDIDFDTAFADDPTDDDI